MKTMPAWTMALPFAIATLFFLAQAESAQRGLSRDEAVEAHQHDRNHAVVIGIDQYENLRPLNYAVADANAIAKTLKVHGYIVHQFTDTEATAGRIFRKFKEISEDIGRDGKHTGSLIVYFAGHGFTQDDRNYLATSDTLSESIANTSIGLTELTEYAESLKIAQRTFFIDACRNDAARSVAQSNQRFVRDNYASGLAVLQSTQPGGFSYEDAQLGHGVYTHFLIRGLAGEAADADGWITFNGIKEFLTKKVRQHVQDRYRQIQAPYASTDYTGTFILAKYSERTQSQILNQGNRNSGPSPGIAYTRKVESVMDAIFQYGEAHTTFGNSGGLKPGYALNLVHMTDSHLNRINDTLSDLKTSRTMIDFNGPELDAVISVFQRKANLYQEHKALLLAIDQVDKNLETAHRGIQQAIANDQWTLKDNWQRDRIKLNTRRKQLFNHLVANQHQNIDLNEPSMSSVRQFVNALAVRYPDMHKVFGN